jgi:hypothetical protein
MGAHMEHRRVYPAHALSIGLRTLIAAVAVVAVFLGAMRATIRWLNYPYLAIRVANRSNSPVTELYVQYDVKRWRADRILPGANAVFNVRTDREACFDLTFKDSSGKMRKRECFVAIEAGERGRVEVKIREHGIVETELSFWRLR